MSLYTEQNRQFLRDLAQNFPPQKSFGDFVRERYGPNWVYANRSTPHLHDRYDKPDCPAVVITPKQQRQLKDNYAKEWGREHDPAFWAMLCALRLAAAELVLTDETREAVKLALDAAAKS